MGLLMLDMSRGGAPPFPRSRSRSRSLSRSQSLSRSRSLSLSLSLSRPVPRPPPNLSSLSPLYWPLLLLLMNPRGSSRAPPLMPMPPPPRPPRPPLPPKCRSSSPPHRSTSRGRGLEIRGESCESLRQCLSLLHSLTTTPRAPFSGKANPALATSARSEIAVENLVCCCTYPSSTGRRPPPRALQQRRH